MKKTIKKKAVIRISERIDVLHASSHSLWEAERRLDEARLWCEQALTQSVS